MRWIKAFFIAVCLFSPMGVSNLRGDMVPAPRAPEKPGQQQTGWQQEREETSIPVFSIASGVVAVSLMVALVALRTIRKRSKDESP
jgi:hypothetical protein